MYKVFNMGHRFEFYVAPEDAQEIIRISESFGVPAKIVGRVEQADARGKLLTLKTPFGEFEYNY